MGQAKEVDFINREDLKTGKTNKKISYSAVIILVRLAGRWKIEQYLIA
jgi:hypothetical protein